MIFDKYRHTRDVKDIEAALRITRESIKGAPPFHADRQRWYHSLSTMLRYQYAVKPNKDDLKEAISAQRECLKSTIASDPDRAKHIETLARLLHELYKLTSEVSDLQAAVAEAHGSVLLAMRPNPGGQRSSPSVPWLAYVSSMLLELYDRTKDERELNNSISLARWVLRLTSVKYPGLGDRIGHLIKALIVRYEDQGNEADLQEAATFISRKRKLEATNTTTTAATATATSEAEQSYCPATIEVGRVPRMG
ncbi:hypothetical protein F5Y14DRAFT_435223 [Nemania sp. NC0429]|nr:hypothetical protein F5Y14DRAFT_435223 [Nemania sp. NC0429]